VLPPETKPSESIGNGDSEGFFFCAQPEARRRQGARAEGVAAAALRGGGCKGFVLGRHRVMRRKRGK